MVFKRLLLLIFLLPTGIDAGAQPLSKTISIDVERARLADVLEQIGQKGNFHFSYNSAHIASDSLVSLHASQLGIGEILNRLLDNNFDYKVAGSYVILRYAPGQLSLILQESRGNQDEYQITGRIIDDLTKKPLANASIYEKNLLQSALSSENGFFTIKLKDIPHTAVLTVSKENYKDLTSHFLPEVIVKTRRNADRTPDGNYVEGDLTKAERTWLGRRFVTSKQKIQSLNIGSFIANAPVQASLSPGLSTHGSLSGQVVNKFSLNATGGYSAGVNGVEIGLLFNINKKDARYFQFGGAFNVVGGTAKGLQIGGLFNNVLDSVNGVQVSLGYNRIGGSVQGFQLGGLLNTVKGSLNGLQMSVVANRVTGDLEGFQFGGLYNNAGQNFSGIQLSAAYNASRKSLRGVQLAPVNYTRNLKGLQIGLVNIADTSSGYSFGLLNIIRTGYHKISVNSNEIINLNAALKTGNQKFYTMLLGGMNPGPSNRLYSLGLGIGKELLLFENLRLAPEVSTRYLYMGAWQDVNLLNRLDLNLNFKLNNWLTLSGGPALNYYHSEQGQKIGDYVFLRRRKSWVGWNLGIMLF